MTDKNSHGPERILITRTDRLGDLVISTPVLEAFKRKFPSSHIGFLVHSQYGDLLRDHPFIDELILYDKGGQHRGIMGNLKLALQLRGKWDCVIHLHGTNRMHWLSYLAGIPKRIGYSRKLSFLLTRSIEDKKSLGIKHEANYNFDLLEDHGLSYQPSFHPIIIVREEARRSLAVKFTKAGLGAEPYLVIHPFASCPSRLWNPEKYAQVGKYLAKKKGWKVVIVGEGRKIVAERVQEAMGAECVNLCGQLSMAELVACLAESQFVISNDSGPAHLAAALKRPVLTLFGRIQPGLGPERWVPLGDTVSWVQQEVGCFYCLAHDCDIDFLCMKSLSVDTVCAKASELIERLEPSKMSQFL